MRSIVQGTRAKSCLTESGSVEPAIFGRFCSWLGLYTSTVYTGGRGLVGWLLLPLLNQFQSPPQRNAVIVGELSFSKPGLSAVSLWQHVYSFYLRNTDWIGTRRAPSSFHTAVDQLWPW